MKTGVYIGEREKAHRDMAMLQLANQQKRIDELEKENAQLRRMAWVFQTQRVTLTATNMDIPFPK